MAEHLFKVSGIADEGGDLLERQIDLHHELNWQAIELRNINGQPIDNWESKDLEHVAEQLESSGMTVSCLASNIGKLTLEDKAAPMLEKENVMFERLLGHANKLKAPYIRVMAYKQGDMSEAAWKAEAIARLQELAGAAGRAGVVLALENCQGWHARSGKGMAELLDKVGSDSLVCLYDTGNPICLYGIDAWEYYVEVKERIQYIHIKDASAVNSYCYLGKGAAQIERVLEDQYASGYRGYVSIEPHLAKSAHKPNLPGSAETAYEVYKQYGFNLNEMLHRVITKSS